MAKGESIEVASDTRRAPAPFETLFNASEAARLKLSAGARNGPMSTKVMLEDVEKDGEVLLLDDGRRLKVPNPDDATVASIWLPPARLTLRKGKRGAANLSVTNEETGETVSARADA